MWSITNNFNITSLPWTKTVMDLERAIVAFQSAFKGFKRHWTPPTPPPTPKILHEVLVVLFQKATFQTGSISIFSRTHMLQVRGSVMPTFVNLDPWLQSLVPHERKLMTDFGAQCILKSVITLRVLIAVSTSKHLWKCNCSKYGYVGK